MDSIITVYVRKNEENCWMFKMFGESNFKNWNDFPFQSLIYRDIGEILDDIVEIQLFDKPFTCFSSSICNNFDGTYYWGSFAETILEKQLINVINGNPRELYIKINKGR